MVPARQLVPHSVESINAGGGSAIDMLDASGEALNPLKCYCAIRSWLVLITQVRRSMGMHIITSVCCLERATRRLK